MRELNLTSAQFEHTLGVLSEVDLTPVISAFNGGGKMVDILGLLPVLGQAREKKLFRRLEAIWSADPDELERAETDEEQMVYLMRKAAKVPIQSTLEGLSAFFDSLGLSLDGIPDSSRIEMLRALTKTTGETDGAEEPSPSGD